MKLMITRPREDAEPLADELAALGVETTIEPLLAIELLDAAAPDLDGVQALLMTSANGVRAFALISPERKVPIFAVGDASARAAVAAGFEAVKSAAGDVDTLAELVGRELNADGGAVLHVAGTKVAGDLAGLLNGAGFEYRRIQLYHAKKAEALSPEGVSAIKDGLINGVVLYSPRTAAAFVALLTKAGLKEAGRRMHAYCLSSAVAAKAGAIDWGGIVVAETPDQAALIKSVRESPVAD